MLRVREGKLRYGAVAIKWLPPPLTAYICLLGHIVLPTACQEETKSILQFNSLLKTQLKMDDKPAVSLVIEG